ncbi:MAG: hypothetical protein A4E19_16230 [Nitrospira sp. SG-bin1]|nr:MAG: hypothetical protein A4E19_16230 [Nitrospira sp. SG-bin1]
MDLKTSRDGFLPSRHRSIAWWSASATVCGASMAWVETTSVGSANGAEALSTRLVIGWMGLFIAAGFCIAGFVCWPYRRDPARRGQVSAISAYDSVTGLPTRRLYLVLLGQALSRAEAATRHVAVLVCVLEQFRPLTASSPAPNMTLVVRVQAARIKSALRPHDVVARLDEYTFAVIVDNVASPDEARWIAEKIHGAIALPLLIEGQEMLLSCRIGGIVGPQRGTKAETLLDAAADALKSGRPNGAEHTLIVEASQPWATPHEANILPSPVSGRHEAPLNSSR